MTQKHRNAGSRTEKPKEHPCKALHFRDQIFKTHALHLKNSSVLLLIQDEQFL